MPRAAVEEDDAVAARAAGVARRVLLARPFDEYLHLPPDERIVFALADFVDGFEQAVVAFLADFLRHLVGHRRGGRVAAFGVFENKCVVEFHFAAERKRLFKIFLRLAGKADDDVRRDADVWFRLPKFFDDGEKFFARVATVHELEQAVAAALQRNVRALDELGQSRVSLDEIVAVTFRMRRGETDAFESINRVNGFEELDEGGFPLEFTL